MQMGAQINSLQEETKNLCAVEVETSQSYKQNLNCVLEPLHFGLLLIFFFPQL